MSLDHALVSSLQAWCFGPDGFTREARAVPALDPDQIRVQVERVCLEPGDFSRSEGALAPGGGLVGVVTECGDAASALKADRVLVSPLRACGECHTCRRGIATVCESRVLLGQDVDGGCAESVVASARWVTRLDRGLALASEDAAFVAGPALTAYALYCRAGVGPGDYAIVVGCGPIAGVLHRLAEARGVRVIRGQSASELVEKLESFEGKGRPQKLFVCDGPDSLAEALAIAHPGSVISTCNPLGLVSSLDLCQRELSLLGTSFGHPDLLTEVAALVSKGELSVADFVLSETLSSATPESVKNAHAAGKCLVARH